MAKKHFVVNWQIYQQGKKPKTLAGRVNLALRDANSQCVM
jgi:hypothetical protein